MRSFPKKWSNVPPKQFFTGFSKNTAFLYFFLILQNEKIFFIPKYRSSDARPTLEIFENIVK